MNLPAFCPPTLKLLAVLATTVLLTGAGYAATVSFSSSAPLVGSNDIANLTGASSVANNVSTGDPNATYVADDRPVQGQSFVTGTNAAGYQLTAVTLRQVTYPTYALVPDLTYSIRITRLSGGTLSVLASESASVPEGTQENFPTIDGGNTQGPGSGRFISFMLAMPIALSPNTTYGFDIGGGATRHYWEMDGTASNPYAGGSAYSSGANGVANVTLTPRSGDHVFVVKLAPASAPVVTQPTIVPTNTIYAGGGVTLSVSAAGTPPIHLQWRVDDGSGPTIISGANETNLVVDTTGFLGPLILTYDVVVTNRFGSVISPPASLTILDASAPVVTVDTTPASATRYVGQEITFAAAFDGTQPIFYQWQNFGENLPDATNAALTLTNLELSNEGNYSLLASNAIGATSSTVAVLTVLPAPPAPSPGSYAHAVLTNHPIAYWRLNDPAGSPLIYDLAGSHNAEHNNVTLGTAGLQSPAYPGFSADNTAGSFDGVSSAATTGASLMNGLTNLTVLGWFNPAGPNDAFAGLFGQNDAFELGYSDSAGVNLWIQIAGVWLNPRTGTNGFTIGDWYFVAVVADGANVDIYVNGALRAHESEGMPTASSSFGFNIGGGGIFRSDSDYFNGLIEDVAILDQALSQREIQDLYSAAVGVLPPTILTQPRSQVLYAGRTAHFTLGGVGGTPPLAYQWQKRINSDFDDLSDGGNTSGSTTSSLIVSSVASGDATDYRVIVSNPGGSITSSVVSLAIVQPGGTPYESAALTLGPCAYWRLNELDDPSTGSVLAHEYAGGFAGIYGGASQNGFNGISGPQPSDGFPAFELENTALQPSSGTEESWVIVPALNLNTNSVTFSMWVKPTGSQGDYTGLLVTRSGTQAGVGYGGDFSGNAGQLAYTWNDNSTWTFQSGLAIPPDQWSFVAVVIEPAMAVLYLYNTNGQRSATNTVSHTSEAWNGEARIGGDAEHLARTFNGIIDEVAVFRYALTPAQVLNLYNGTAPPSTRLTLQRIGSNLRLSWPEGSLQSANAVTGTWSVVTEASSPYDITATETQKFYRVLVLP